MKAIIFLVLVSLVILLPSFGMAQGGWITLPGQAFIVRDSADNWTNEISEGGPSFLYPLSSGGVSFVAPVVFPPEADGLSVRQINVTVGDDDAGSYVYIALFRMNRYSGVTQAVFNADTGVSPNTPGKTILTDTTGGYRLIDSQKYGWFVYILFGGTPASPQNLKLYAARIQYQ